MRFLQNQWLVYIKNSNLNQHKILKISILTLFPQLYQPFIQQSIIGKATQKGLISIDPVSLFQFEEPGNRIDSPTYGHGAGMLIRPDIIEAGIEHVKKPDQPTFTIFFSPQGKKLDQQMLGKLYEQIRDKHLILVASRYEGVDDRVEQEYADMSLSIGDYVLMGGDLPAMVLMESLLRFVPGIIGKQESVLQDSFSKHLVDYPEYTAPLTWHGMTVPDIVRSGNHGALNQWREEQQYERTVKHHFDWLRSFRLSSQERAKARRQMPRHYVVLMHDEVYLKSGLIGTSSVTSLDIHDIARSCATYGIEQYFLVTPLQDQQQVVATLLDFWNRPEGKEYNKHRHQAMKAVQMASSLNDVVAAIEAYEGKKPLLMGTSAKMVEGSNLVTFHDQEEVWQHDRPVLIILGTSHGLAHTVTDRCDYMLVPIDGMTDFNHLSVRSAAAVILDRWLGMQPKWIASQL